MQEHEQRTHIYHTKPKGGEKNPSKQSPATSLASRLASGTASSINPARTRSTEARERELTGRCRSSCSARGRGAGTRRGRRRSGRWGPRRGGHRRPGGLARPLPRSASPLHQRLPWTSFAVAAEWGVGTDRTARCQQSPRG